MPFSIKVLDDHVHIDWYGVLSNEDLHYIGSKLPEIAKKLGHAPDVLHTFDKVTEATMKPWDAFQHSLRREDTRLANKARSAAVAKTEKVRAMALLFQQLNRNPHIEMEIFPSEAEALAWLHEERGLRRPAPARQGSPDSGV